MSYHCEPDVIGIVLGTVDEETVNGILGKSGAHIFVDEKAGWYELPEDNVPRYSGFPSSFQAIINDWKESKQNLD